MKLLMHSVPPLLDPSTNTPSSPNLTLPRYKLTHVPCSITTFASTLMFTSLGSFYNGISDPAIGDPFIGILSSLFHFFACALLPSLFEAALHSLPAGIQEEWSVLPYKHRRVSPTLRRWYIPHTP